MSLMSDIGYCPRCGTTHYLGEYCPTQPPTSMGRCARHNSYFFGPSCYLCDEDARRAGANVIGMLKAQVDDHYAELVQLRARVVELERIIRRTDQVEL